LSIGQGGTPVTIFQRLSALSLGPQCRYLAYLLTALDSYRLTAQMNKRFVLVQTLKITLTGLLQRLCDDVFYVWVCVGTKSVKSIAERICHVDHYRRSGGECAGLALCRSFSVLLQAVNASGM
jgi:hypothetical protein